MGQYYKVILFDYDQNKKKIIRFSLEPYDMAIKLGEHCFIKNKFMLDIEYLLCPLSPFYKSRIVWAGDYAENEENEDINLYNKVECHIIKSSYLLLNNLIKSKPMIENYNIIVNHTKKEYINKNKYTIIHPLPLLTSDGNGQGGGDYFGKNDNLCGSWKGDIISVDKTIPDNYTEFTKEFTND